MVVARPCHAFTPMLVALAASLAFVAPVRAHTAIVVGVDANGRLKVVMPGSSTTIVPFSVFPQAPGWAFGALGFESAFVDYPALDLYVPSGACDVEIVLSSFDPGCAVWGPVAPLEVGEALHCGAPFFDYHPLWQIIDGPGGGTFTLHFYVHDRNAVHADSDVFSITLTAEYCPADFDKNGYVNGDDFDSFTFYFDLGDPAADFDGNTFVNGDDFDFFTAAFDAGC